MIELTVYFDKTDISGKWSFESTFVALINPDNIEMMNISVSGDPRTVVYFTSGKVVNVKEDLLTIQQRIDLNKMQAQMKMNATKKK